MNKLLAVFFIIFSLGQLSIESWASNDLSNILGEFNPETSPANQKAYLGHELSRLAAIVERGIVDATENKVQKKRALLILTALINSSDEHEQNLVLGLWEYLLSPSSRLEVGEDGFPLHLNAQDDLVTDNLLFIRFLTELVSNLTLTSFKFGLQADIFFLPLINYANQKLLTVVDSENYKDGQSMALAHWLTQFLSKLALNYPKLMENSLKELNKGLENFKYKENLGYMISMKLAIKSARELGLNGDLSVKALAIKGNSTQTFGVNPIDLLNHDESLQLFLKPEHLTFLKLTFK